MGEVSGDEARLMLYVRARCHLCDQAREVLTRVTESTGCRWHEVDIDAAPPAQGLVERYGELVPVVTVDGVPQGYWRLDADRITHALTAGAR